MVQRELSASYQIRQPAIMQSSLMTSTARRCARSPPSAYPTAPPVPQIPGVLMDENAVVSTVCPNPHTVCRRTSLRTLTGWDRLTFSTSTTTPPATSVPGNRIDRRSVPLVVYRPYSTMYSEASCTPSLTVTISTVQSAPLPPVVALPVPVV